METPTSLGHGAADDAIAAQLGASATAPVGTVGVGVVAPYDFALDRELWRWAPEEVTLHATRTPYSALPVSVEQAATVSDTEVVAQCTADLITVGPRVLAYACTSGSFIGGHRNQRALVEAMVAAGAPDAVTTSGALLEALTALGVTRLGVATPYDAAVTERLHAFLDEADDRVREEPPEEQHQATDKPRHRDA